MKKHKLIIPLFFLTALIFTASCEKTYFLKGELNERVTYLYLNYWNPDIDNDGTYGDAPQIELDSANSSKAIKIDFTKDFIGVTNTSRAQIIIDNMRIADEYGNFEIQNISVEEYKDGVWQTQSASENPVLYNGVENLDVVLVLDASKSMEDNYTKLRTAAKIFIDNIKTKIPTTRFGIVSFADQITTFDISTDAAAAKTFIDQMQPTGYTTTLYSGMIDGIALLQATQADSKVLVTFTDGGDNEDKYSYTAVIDSLNIETTNNVKIQSYAIGLAGDADIEEEILTKMCVRGFGLFPRDTQEMEDFFDYFSKVVSSVYNLTYERNLIKIPKTDKRQIRFKLETIQK